LGSCTGFEVFKYEDYKTDCYKDKDVELSYSYSYSYEYSYGPRGTSPRRASFGPTATSDGRASARVEEAPPTPVVLSVSAQLRGLRWVRALPVRDARRERLLRAEDLARRFGDLRRGVVEPCGALVQDVYQSRAETSTDDVS